MQPSGRGAFTFIYIQIALEFTQQDTLYMIFGTMEIYSHTLMFAERGFAVDVIVNVMMYLHLQRLKAQQRVVG